MLFNLIYNFLIEISLPILWFCGVFSKKKYLFVKGRSQTFKILKSKKVNIGKWVWFHCSSLGEFEQARQLILEFKKTFPN